MGRFTQTGASGEGDSLIDGGTPQAPIQIDIANVVNTGFKARQIYTQAPFFVQFGGQIMIGNPDVSDPTVVMTFPIHWAPHQQYDVPGNQFVVGVFWKLPAGLTCDITVEW